MLRKPRKRPYRRVIVIRQRIVRVEEWRRGDRPAVAIGSAAWAEMVRSAA